MTTTITTDVRNARRGDIVRFVSYSLRIEEEPVRGSGSITLRGRSSEDGCPLVTKRFLGGRQVTIERERD